MPDNLARAIAADGVNNDEIAERLDTRRAIVSMWWALDLLNQHDFEV